jgi:opacity protein-like surface antigen
MLRRSCITVTAILASTLVGVSAFAQDGFYGGYTDSRLNLQSGAGPYTPWSKLAPVAKEDAAGASLLFGGYRWRDHFAVEAALTGLSGGRAPGLRLDPTALLPGAPGVASADPRPQAWNVDVFTNWSVQPAFALYGRLGYGYSDPKLIATSSGSGDSAKRNTRDGFNVGFGLRYDMTQSLGLRLEYARYGLPRFGAELGAPLPESDQLSIGVQYRF